MDVKQTIIAIAGVKTNDSFEKYLDLPTKIGEAKVKSFQYMLDQTQSKIFNWKTKFFSKEGKEILLKLVLQAIPTYTMGIFLLPKSISGKFYSLLKNFWWGMGMVMLLKSIDLVGRDVEFQKIWVGSVLEISTVSTWHYWLNKYGDSFSALILSQVRSLRPNTIKQVN